ncbi:hypothetical protein A1I_06825 [Rickettsia bellii OSU 85-389]|nr:hypothetical protein A1I_06825 [Rickettsia bellii OSU 85-389]
MILLLFTVKYKNFLLFFVFLFAEVFGEENIKIGLE